MTRRLILMRHAKSSWACAGPDHERPLNARGHASAQTMGTWLRELGHIPDEVLTSTARRTLDTLDELGFDAPAREVPALYMAEAETMLRVLRGATGRTVLMLGHNPGIADFARQLLVGPPDHGRFIDYPTCATLVARFDLTDWSTLRFETGHPEEFQIPRALMSDAPAD